MNVAANLVEKLIKQRSTGGLAEPLVETAEGREILQDAVRETLPVADPSRLVVSVSAPDGSPRRTTVAISYPMELLIPFIPAAGLHSRIDRQVMVP